MRFGSFFNRIDMRPEITGINNSIRDNDTKKLEAYIADAKKKLPASEPLDQWLQKPIFSVGFKNTADVAIFHGKIEASDILKKHGVSLNNTADGSAFITASRIQDRPTRGAYYGYLVSDLDIKKQINHRGIGGLTALNHLIDQKDAISISILLSNGANTHYPSYLRLWGAIKNSYEYTISKKRTNVSDPLLEEVIAVLAPHKNETNVINTTSRFGNVGLFVNRKGRELLTSLTKDLEHIDGFGGLSF